MLDDSDGEKMSEMMILQRRRLELGSQSCTAFVGDETIIQVAPKKSIIELFSDDSSSQCSSSSSSRYDTVKIQIVHKISVVMTLLYS